MINGARASDYTEPPPDSPPTPEDGDHFPPSAKALGKRRVEPTEELDSTYTQLPSRLNLKTGSTDPHDADHYDQTRDQYYSGDLPDSDSDESWVPHHQQPVQHFVYDAAAERTQQRLKEGHTLLVNGVH